MKKILPVLALACLFIQCEKKSAVTPAEGEEKADTVQAATTEVTMKAFPTLADSSSCDFFKDLYKLPMNKQVDWLKLHQAEICADDKLKLCITDQHHMKQVDYDKAIKDYWLDPSLAKSTEFTLDQLFLDNSCGYGYYLVFDADLNEEIFFQKQSYFSSILTSYSIPFLQGLKSRYSLTGSSKIKFTKGKVNGVTVILLNVVGQSDANFDYSHYPGGNTAA